jgi:hypothetical protein
MRVLEGLIGHMKFVANVRFACLAEAVRAWRSANPVPLATLSDAQG